MTEREPFKDEAGEEGLGEFTEEAREVYGRLLRDAVTFQPVMAQRVEDDPTGRHLDAVTRDSLVEMLVRAARQRDEPLA